MADEMMEVSVLAKENDAARSLALDPEKQEEFEKKIKKLPNQEDELMTPGVIYLGHLPHGFYEDEIRGFFSQFGTVTNVRVSRSKKTAAPKGYAFVEFACSDVAEIAAETMDNYLMFGRLLKCQFVPESKIHPRMWKGAGRKFRKVPHVTNERKKQNAVKTKGDNKKLVKKLLAKEKKKRKFLKKAGVEYEFPGYVADTQKHSSHKRFGDE